MEKFSYSYPDSTDSSPRSRDVDFDNPPPWDDQNPQSYKVKFLCSYGGKIQPRPHDNQLTYVNGDTKIFSVDRSIRFSVFASKLAAVCGSSGDVSFKYQLPGEDLDALISVTNDEDLELMMHEYDRFLRVSSKPVRMRLFLFPVSGGFGSQGSTQSDRDRFVEELNTVTRLSESDKSVTAPPNNADFLFGSEKVAAPPPIEVKLPVPVAVEPPLFSDQRLAQPEHGINPVEFQRMQLRDHQQQQGAVYMRKNSEDGVIQTGGYFSPPYAQNPAPPPQPQPLPTTIPQTNPLAPPMNFWQGNHNPGGVFPPAAQGLRLPEQPAYMIPPPANVYQAPLQTQGVMRPPVGTGQGNQGGYYPTAYNMTQPLPVGTRTQQPPPFTSGAPPAPYSAVPQPRQVMGIPDTSAYTQVAYGGGMGKQVYYTEAPPPQYHGIGLPVTGQDGKLVAMNMSPKVSSQSSDSAV